MAEMYKVELALQVALILILLLSLHCYEGKLQIAIARPYIN